jgi:thiamine pyrophosphokinase
MDVRARIRSVCATRSQVGGGEEASDPGRTQFVLTLPVSIMHDWNTDFLNHGARESGSSKRALIILNQPTARELLQRVWASCHWRACADGGANRLHDELDMSERDKCVRDTVSLSSSTSSPDLFVAFCLTLSRATSTRCVLMCGRFTLARYVPAHRVKSECLMNCPQSVEVVQDHDQYSTDLMKCLHALEEKELSEGGAVHAFPIASRDVLLIYCVMYSSMR